MSPKGAWLGIDLTIGYLSIKVLTVTYSMTMTPPPPSMYYYALSSGVYCVVFGVAPPVEEGLN